MSLQLKINAALALAFILGSLAAGLICETSVEANARREVLVEAGLMMDSALAIRAYTADEIDPLLDDRLKTEFLPQSVPFYAATQNFLRLRERHPQYTYKEATLNPTNPRDRASDWEADIIQRFRNDPGATEFTGERDTPMGPSLYRARPIRARPECLSCHGLATAAPRTVLERYGSDNGFGWQPNEVIGAQVVSVPLASAQASARETFRTLMISLLAVFLALWVAVNLVLHVLVMRPLRSTAQAAERLSVGELSAPDFPAGGGEIAQLGRAFERMRKSLEKALKLLEH
jgi:HAMP domain-containing protein